MVHHRAEGRGVADLEVETGRVAQVGEEDGQRADRDRLVGGERLVREQGAEHLQCRDLRRAERFVAPGGPLEHEELLVLAVVDDGDAGALARRDCELSHLAAVAGAQAVRPRGELRIERPLLSGREELLSDNVRGHLRAADAELPHLDLPDGARRPERELDGMLELDAEVDCAAVAMHVRVDIAQALRALLRAAAHRTEQVPAELEQPGARGVEEKLQHLAAGGSPGVRERVRAQPRHGEVVRMLEDARQPSDELVGLSLLSEYLPRGAQPAPAAGGQPRLLPRYRLVLDLAVVAAEGVLEADAAPAADLEGDGDATERIARLRPNLVPEER